MCNRLPEMMKNGDAGIVGGFYALRSTGVFARGANARRFLNMTDPIVCRFWFLFYIIRETDTVASHTFCCRATLGLESPTGHDLFPLDPPPAPPE